MFNHISAAGSGARARRFELTIGMLCLCLHAGAAVTLPSYNIDADQISVSGLSSGGYMAVQLHVAYSATFKAGAGVVAGGPFYCAQGSVVTATGPCMAATPTNKPPTAALMSITNTWASQGGIDPTSNLAASKVYLYSGTLDSVVKQLVQDETNNYYKNYVNNANIFYKNNLASEHAMITDYYGNTCATKSSPYINNCSFDLSGEILKWIYGPLTMKNTGAPGGVFIEFNQADFIANPQTHGMADTGWVYVPASCGSNQLCKLHVALHGCKQDAATVQDKFYRNTGYNKWADTNNIIVLYPQSAPSSTGNPNGCWDWWGYDDPNYAKKSGRQMAAIKGMVNRIATSGSAVPVPPANLAVSGKTANSVSLTWSAAPNATGYNLYRNGNKVNAAPIAATSYNDGGLAANTTYSYAVSSLASGQESALSNSVSASTSGTFSCTTSSASNYAHVIAGRAYDFFGYAYALGSNQGMGWDNIFIGSQLAQTAPGYYVVGSCP
jgi:poly(3-hydroxybutyrate) depolymerase